MGRELADYPPLGGSVQVEVAADVVQVGDNLTLHGPFPYASEGFITRAMALEKLCHIASFSCRSLRPWSVMV